MPAPKTAMSKVGSLGEVGAEATVEDTVNEGYGAGPAFVHRM